MLSFTGRSSKPAAYESQFFHRHLRYHHHQHLLMNVDSCYCVGHCFLSGEGTAERTTNRKYAPLRAFALPPRKDNVTVIDSKRASPVKLLDGLNLSRAVTTSPALAASYVISDRPHFHLYRWAEGPWALLLVAALCPRRDQEERFARNSRDLFFRHHRIA